MSKSLNIKICGITQIEDAVFCTELGIWAIGLNFIKGTPRYIDQERAKIIANETQGKIKRVGLFYQQTPSDIEQTRQDLELDYVQAYGLDRFTPKGDIATPGSKCYDGELYLHDHVSDRLGGTGMLADRSNLDGLCTKFRVLLAGGLDATNVDLAKGYDLFGVDVCSGVESSPGIKDHSKIKAFVKAVEAL